MAARAGDDGASDQTGQVPLDGWLRAESGAGEPASSAARAATASVLALVDRTTPVPAHAPAPPLSGGAVPVLDGSAADRHGLAVDPRVTGLLPWLDGTRTCDEVVAVCGLSEREALRALSDLVEARLVRLV